MIMLSSMFTILFLHDILPLTHFNSITFNICRLGFHTYFQKSMNLNLDPLEFSNELKIAYDDSMLLEFRFSNVFEIFLLFTITVNPIQFNKEMGYQNTSQAYYFLMMSLKRSLKKNLMNHLKIMNLVNTLYFRFSAHFLIH